jgi:hypothetical protein
MGFLWDFYCLFWGNFNGITVVSWDFLWVVGHKMAYVAAFLRFTLSFSHVYSHFVTLKELVTKNLG